MEKINENFIVLNQSNITDEHICCAFSDKKCSEGYSLKKDWLKQAFKDDYVFRRLNARAKVFMEYGPAEKGWAPIYAPNYLLINCFWVSGQYKEQGYAKELLRLALEDAKSNGKNGLVTVVGTTKFHFMSDTKWLLKQGFETCDTTETGFSLLVKKLDETGVPPKFNESVKIIPSHAQKGILVYYSDRCPYTDYHVKVSLKETAEKRHLPLSVIKFETMSEAQSAPTPATIFSLYVDGNFVTTDLSVCMDSRFDKVMEKYGKR